MRHIKGWFILCFRSRNQYKYKNKYTGTDIFKGCGHSCLPDLPTDIPNPCHTITPAHTSGSPIVL